MPSPTRTANEQKIGDEYASCMDTAAIDKLGIAPLQPELDRIAALNSAAELPALLAHLHTIGVNAFFGMGSNQDFADSNSVICFLRRGRPGPAGARLLHAHRRQVGGAAQAICRPRAQDVCAGRRAGSAGREGCRHRAGPRNPPGQGLAHHHRAARPAEPEPSHRRGQLRQGADALFRCRSMWPPRTRPPRAR